MKLRAADLADATDLSSLTVTVFGLGKMGLPLASVLAEYGARVHGVDVDDATVEAVNEGRAPVTEPGVQDLLDEHAGSRLTATTNGEEAVVDSDVSIVLVPTLVDEEFDPDLDPVLAAADVISDGLESGDLVILESTVPPGTTAGEFTDAVEPEHLTAGEDFGVAHCPERTSSGRVVRDLTESYPKIVGGLTDDGTAAAGALYRIFNEPGVIELPTATAAEAVKVFEGVYRDVNIALANELGKACEEWGLNAATVFEAANSQPYCDIHDPGIGVGGHCIPVYPHFVVNRASETPLVETARNVNDGMPRHAVDTIDSLLANEDVSLTDATVLVLGLTYRPGVRETRFAPGFDVVDILQTRAATVAAHDPILPSEEIAASGARPVDDVLDEEWDAVVLATGHDEYRALDLDALYEGMRTPVLLDGRNFFAADEVSNFSYACIGDGSSWGGHRPQCSTSRRETGITD